MMVKKSSDSGGIRIQVTRRYVAMTTSERFRIAYRPNLRSIFLRSFICLTPFLFTKLLRHYNKKRRDEKQPAALYTE